MRWRFLSWRLTEDKIHFGGKIVVPGTSANAGCGSGVLAENKQRGAAGKNCADDE
jgi:hypothetical protein